MTSTAAAPPTISTRASSIARALDEIGDMWSLLILQEIFLGVHTFTALGKTLGASKTVLTSRLASLEQVNCIKKVNVSSTANKSEYHLTEKSIELYPVALMALQWEREFYPTDNNRAIQLTHSLCGKSCWPSCHCANCQQVIQSGQVAYSPGPGAGLDERLVKTRRRSSITSHNVVSTGNVFKNLVHIVGDRWTANLIALAYHGCSRFSQFHSELPVASNILADRLEFLVQEGVFCQAAYQQNPLRFDYQLTDKGKALYPYFITLLQWGDKWCGDGIAVKPMELTHNTCFNLLRAVVVCNQCKQELHAHEVKFTLA